MLQSKDEFCYNLPFGAALVGNGLTRFRIWAPAQNNVAVEIDRFGRVAMRRSDGGWFEAEVASGAGAHYRYVLGSGLTVPDPASRSQADDVHGPSVVIDPRSYQWRNPSWRGRPWEEAVLYELHGGAFGGFEGVMRELDRLAKIGVTAVELMPINDFPGRRNWGYDGVLPFAPDGAYGSIADLKAVVDAAHERGLMMFLDVVYNHFGPDGNYLSSYAPQFFREDVQTPWGAAVDFRTQEVRDFFTENALYWLMEYRFDGLRFDAVHAITEADWLDEMAARVRATVEKDRHVHLVLEHDGNVADHLRRDFNAQWNDDGHHVLHVMLSGEREGYYTDYADEPAKRLARALSEGFIYQGEPSRHRDGAPRGTRSADLPPTAFVFFLQNHDQIGNRAFGDRLTATVNPKALEAAIALQCLCPQIPLLFMGEEEGSVTPFQFFTDHHDELADAVREGRRNEFVKFAAFSDPAHRAAIPDPNDPATFDRSRPRPGPEASARRDLYRRLLALRAEYLVPFLKRTQAVRAEALGPYAVAATWRLGNGASWTLACNLGGESCSFGGESSSFRLQSGRAVFGTLHGDAIGPFTTVALMEPFRG